MKNTILIIAAFALVMTSCRKGEIATDLSGTKWTEQDGSATIQFTKRWVKVNDEKINDKGETVHVADGQIWIDKDGTLSYLYDYKLSGTNLFVMSETTSVFVDPSFVGIKYKQD